MWGLECLRGRCETPCHALYLHYHLCNTWLIGLLMPISKSKTLRLKEVTCTREAPWLVCHRTVTSAWLQTLHS